MESDNRRHSPQDPDIEPTELLGTPDEPTRVLPSHPSPPSAPPDLASPGKPPPFVLAPSPLLRIAHFWLGLGVAALLLLLASGAFLLIARASTEAQATATTQAGLLLATAEAQATGTAQAAVTVPDQAQVTGLAGTAGTATIQEQGSGTTQAAATLLAAPRATSTAPAQATDTAQTAAQTMTAQITATAQMATVTSQPAVASVTPHNARLSPDAVLAADAGLKEPRGVGVDAQGNVYIGDSGNDRVIRLDPSGKVSATWGGATDTSAPGKFGLLADVAASPDGHVATLDVATGDIQVFTPDGKLGLQIPNTSPNSSGIALGPDRHIWVAFTSFSRVLRFTPEGKPDGTFTGGAAGSPQHFDQPIDVAVAPDGTAYVIDLRGRIMRLNAQGQIAAQWPVEWGGARGGSHLAFWQNRVVWTIPEQGRLGLLDPSVGTVRYVGMVGTAAGQFRLPIGLAAGPNDKLYVVDSDNARVQVFSTLDER